MIGRDLKRTNNHGLAVTELISTYIISFNFHVILNFLYMATIHIKSGLQLVLSEKENKEFEIQYNLSKTLLSKCV